MIKTVKVSREEMLDFIGDRTGCDAINGTRYCGKTIAGYIITADDKYFVPGIKYYFCTECLKFREDIKGLDTYYYETS